MLQGVLVNGSLGKVVEFVSIHEAQQRHIEMAELERRKEGQVTPIVNPPAVKEDEPGLIALDDHTFQRNQLWPLVKVMAHPDVIEWQKQWDKDRHREEEMDSDWAVSQWHDSFHE
ncbi:hypothetical protein J3R82DRAFT_1168 [Butyriboletus roseoflavus]|nr:hypothetical protein J3R82DRAFT_1168 [Butyriboletus roseoflavus]